jgi:signal transduction histidine kinase
LHQEIRVSVEDRGVGIGPDEQLLVFEPFYRSPRVLAAQIHGTGLGLAVANRIVEAMGGKISVVSQVNVGSVFTLHLPVVDKIASSPRGKILETTPST